MNNRKPSEAVKDIIDRINRLDPEEAMVFHLWIKEPLDRRKDEGFRIYNAKQIARLGTKHERAEAARLTKKDRDYRVEVWCIDNLKVGDVVSVGGTNGYREVAEILPVRGYIKGWQVYYESRFRFSPKVSPPERKLVRTGQYTENQMCKVVCILRNGEWINVNKLAKGTAR